MSLCLETVRLQERRQPVEYDKKIFPFLLPKDTSRKLVHTSKICFDFFSVPMRCLLSFSFWPEAARTHPLSYLGHSTKETLPGFSHSSEIHWDCTTMIHRDLWVTRCCGHAKIIKNKRKSSPHHMNTKHGHKAKFPNVCVTLI